MIGSIKYLLIIYIYVSCAVLFGQGLQTEVIGNVTIQGDFLISNNDTTSISIGQEASLPKVNSSNLKNTVVGYHAGGGSGLAFFNSPHNNTLVGARAGDDLSSGDQNTFLGSGAGAGDFSLSRNVFLGRRSGENSTGNGNVFIGNEVGMNETRSDVLMIGNVGDGKSLIFGDFVNSKLGIASNGMGNSLSDVFQIEAAQGENAFRVRINGATKLRVRANGGVSIGVNKSTQEGGIRIAALEEGERRSNLLADEMGNLRRGNRDEWITIPPSDFRTNDWDGSRFIMRSDQVSWQSSSGYGNYWAPIKLPDQSRIKKIKVRFLDDSGTTETNVFLYKSISGSLGEESVELLLSTRTSVNNGTDYQTVEIDLDYYVDNSSIDSRYFIYVGRNSNGSDGLLQGFTLRSVSINYEL